MIGETHVYFYKNKYKYEGELLAVLGNTHLKIKDDKTGEVLILPISETVMREPTML